MWLENKWVKICTYCLLRSSGLKEVCSDRDAREKQRLRVVCEAMKCFQRSFRAMHLVTVQDSRNCSHAEETCVMFDFHLLTPACPEHVGEFCSIDSFQSLVYEWFTAKRNALWISLLFNLSQRPLKTGSNALISYSEERLIYRYACHLLLLVFINKAPHCRWCLNKNCRPIRLPQDVRVQREFAKWLQYINCNENNHGLWGNIFICVTADHKGSSIGGKKKKKLWEMFCQVGVRSEEQWAITLTKCYFDH